MTSQGHEPADSFDTKGPVEAILLWFLIWEMPFPMQIWEDPQMLQVQLARSWCKLLPKKRIG